MSDPSSIRSRRLTADPEGNRFAAGDIDISDQQRALLERVAQDRAGFVGLGNFG